MSSPAKYHHRRTAARALLLTGYFFLFAIQFSYRYYDVANFFVYKSNAVRFHPAPHQQQTTAHTYQANPKRPAHLAVDKRFSHKLMLQPFFAAHQAPVPTYLIITRKALPPPVVYSTPDLPTNSLRGPPTV